METPPEPRWGCMKRRDMEQIIIPFFANWTKFKGLKGNNIHIDNLNVKKLRENPAICFTGSRISGARLSIISLLEIKRDPCLTCIVGVPPLSHLYHHLVETMQCWLSDLQSKALLPAVAIRGTTQLLMMLDGYSEMIYTWESAPKFIAKTSYRRTLASKIRQFGVSNLVWLSIAASTVFFLATTLSTVGVEPFMWHRNQPEIGQLPGALPELL